MSIQNSHQIGDVKVMLKQGPDGVGIESVEKTGTSGNVDTYTITLTNGAKETFTVTNGNGIESITKTGTVGKVDTYTIQFTDGQTTTFTVTNGSDTSINLAEKVTNPATRAYKVGEYVIFNDNFCEVTTAIANGGTFAIGTNLTATSVGLELNDKLSYAYNTVMGAKNIFNTNIINAGASLATITDKGKTVRVSNATAGAWQAVDFKIFVKKNKDYTISTNVAITSGAGFVVIADENNNTIKASSSITENTNVELTFNSGNNNFIRLKLCCTVGTSTLGDVTYDSTMIRLSSDTDPTYAYPTMTNYELTEQKMSYADNTKLGAHNLLDLDYPTIKAINTGGTWNGNVYTINNTTITLNDNKTITINTGTGGASGAVTFLLSTGTLNDYRYMNGMIVSGVPSGTTGSNIFQDVSLAVDPYTSYFFQSGGAEVSISGIPTGSTSARHRIRVNQGATLSNVVIEPMLRLSTDSDPTFAPRALTNLELTNQKQDKLTFDSTPTQNSSNPVTSGGVYDELALKQPKTLATPLTIGGASKTTVEGALGTLADSGLITTGLSFDHCTLVEGGYKKLPNGLVLVQLSVKCTSAVSGTIVKGLPTPVTGNTALSISSNAVEQYEYYRNCTVYNWSTEGRISASNLQFDNTYYIAGVYST